MKNNYCQLWLTVADQNEAKQITSALLKEHLVACVRQFPIVSDFSWKGAFEHSNEVMLVMESRLDMFERVESALTKLHSYETFVLEAVKVDKVSKKARFWLEGALDD